MTSRRNLLAALASILTWAGSGLAADLPASESQFRQELNLGEYGNVSYRDSNAEDIGYDAFRASVASGKRFAIKMDPRNDTAVVAIMNEPVAASEDTSPGSALVDLDGRAVELRPSIGRPMVMNFFFAACPPCIAETPALNAFAKQNPHIDVIAVTFDSPGVARRFVERRGFTWRIVPDARSFIDKARVSSYPTFAYFGKDGKLQGISPGSEVAGDGGMTAAKLERWLRKLEQRTRRLSIAASGPQANLTE